MSKYMIDNMLHLNNINPFANPDVVMPGSWNQPYEYSITKEPSVSNTIHKETTSPLCDYGITAGDKTISVCYPPTPNCPMQRFQEPRRLYDPGMWAYYQPKKGGAPSQTKTPVISMDGYFLIILIVAIIIFILVNLS